jgi:acyl-CoA reductase-like NAD-dependent aldehyde dehydrogenase
MTDEELSNGGKAEKVTDTSLDAGNGNIRCFDPATLDDLGTVPAMSASEVKAAISKARRAQQSWAKTTFEQRRRVMRMIRKYCMEKQEDICRVSCRDTGKTPLEAILGEILTTCAKAEWVCDYGEQALATDHRPTSLITMHKEARVEYHPLGVLGVIAPWNYPFHNMFNHVISGLFAGNAVVTKVSEYTAWSGSYYTRIIREILKAEGHDPEVVQLVTGFAEAGAGLVSGGVDKVIFTGSPGVGKHVMRGASATLTPVVLELGGKDPFIITDDADMKQVVQVALRGVYQNCGQNCVGAERIYVYGQVYDAFVSAVSGLVQQFRQGPSLLQPEVDVGAMTMPSQIDLIQELVDDAVSKGARIITGGRRNPHLDGLFYEPTVLVGVTHAMRIANEEVFGPVMTVIKVKDDEDCIAQVNSTDYGLGSSVFCRDMKRAEALAARIYAGMTNINDFAANYLVQSLPFGGVKISGFDRFAGPEGLRACCLMKTVTSDRFPGVRTNIPPAMEYPMKPAGLKFARGLLSMLFADSLWGRIKGIAALASS